MEKSKTPFPPVLDPYEQASPPPQESPATGPSYPKTPQAQDTTPPVAFPTQPAIVSEPPRKKVSKWLVISSVIILPAAIIFIAFKLITQKGITTPPEPIPTALVEPSTDPTADWKTYTSKDSNFSFKYPDNLFIYQSNPQLDSQYWSNKADGGDPLALKPDEIWLIMSSSISDSTTMDFYNKITNLKVNDTIPESAVTKLSELNTGGIKGSTYYQGLVLNSAGEAIYTYEAIWVKEDTVYKLSLSAITEENLQKYKGVFDQILLTFSFTNPSETPTEGNKILDQGPAKVKECYTKASCKSSASAQVSCANPALVFCICMGGNYETKENPQGQYGICKIEGKEYDEWEYFRKMNPEDSSSTQQ